MSNPPPTAPLAPASGNYLNAPLLSTPVESVSGNRYFQLFGIALLVAGTAELISGILVIADSSGYYVGGTYVGLIALVAGVRATVLATKSHVGWFIIYIIICLIVGIVGLGLQSVNEEFIDSLEACSSYDSSSTSTSCTGYTPTYFRCTGNNDYFLTAQACEATYVYDNGGDSNQCSCVTNDDENTCYSFTNINNCHKLVEKLPTVMKASLSFCVVCVFLSLILLILSLISYFKPKWIQTTAERSTEPATATAVTPNPMV
jgi:hypothetical protein